MLDAEGHVKLIDFGLAKRLGERRSTSLVGTNAYLAPEQVLPGRQHGKEVDWYALGVLIYELVFGEPPFTAENRFELYEQIKFDPVWFPEGTDGILQDLLTGLLCKESASRLGTVGGAKAIQDHPWFNGIDWDEFEARQGRPPSLSVGAADSETTEDSLEDNFQDSDSAENTFEGF